MMLRDEYGLAAVVRSPWRAAGSTFSAFLVCGLVPLAPFVAGVRSAFWVASTATSLMFVVIGAVKSRWSTQPCGILVSGRLRLAAVLPPSPMQSGPGFATSPVDHNTEIADL